jgi:hypothetical protein
MPTFTIPMPLFTISMPLFTIARTFMEEYRVKTPGHSLNNNVTSVSPYFIIE